MFSGIQVKRGDQIHVGERLVFANGESVVVDGRVKDRLADDVGYMIDSAPMFLPVPVIPATVEKRRYGRASLLMLAGAVVALVIRSLMK